MQRLPFFSCAVGFLRDEIAALPRKSDPEGAASLAWQTIALMSGRESREFGLMILQGFSLGSAAEVLDGEACEENDGIEEGFGFGDGYDFCATAAEALVEAISNKAAA